jgi:glucuronide carrier protein
VLGDARYIIWMTLVTVVVQFATAPFTVVGGVALFFTPGSMPLLALLFVAVKGFGVQLINTLMFALEADTVEYGEWKTGQRTEGATYAIFSFTRKITQSIGGALGAFALAIGGYVSTFGPGAVQPESAIIAIKASLGLVPAAAAVLAMLVFIRYPLTEQRYSAIITETDARKKALLGTPAPTIAPMPVPVTV